MSEENEFSKQMREELKLCHDSEVVAQVSALLERAQHAFRGCEDASWARRDRLSQEGRSCEDEAGRLLGEYFTTQERKV
jgi:hypothetical protein